MLKLVSLEKEIIEFYSALEDIMVSLPRSSDIIIVLGFFNVKVGKTDNNAGD